MDFLKKCTKNLSFRSLQKLHFEKEELGFLALEQEGKRFSKNDVIKRIYEKYKKEFRGIGSTKKLFFHHDNSFGKNSGFFKVWMIHRFPVFSRNILGYIDHNQFYYWLNQYSMEQIEMYLPVFILRQLDEYLRDKDLVLVVQHLMEGNNIRTFDRLPYPLTRKMAHNFHNMQRGRNLEQVFYKCLVFGLGGSTTLFEAMSRHWIPRTEVHISYIKKVVSFFESFPELDVQSLRPILGYLNHMFHEHDNYQLKGQTINSIRRAALLYYENIDRGSEGQPRPKSWDGTKFEDWSDDQGFKIIQLKTAAELDFESAKMHHCVRSYAQKCGNGECSIWSLRYVDENNFDTPLATIEVNNQGFIIQAKAQCNERPGDESMKIIRKWMKEQKLRMAEYV